MGRRKAVFSFHYLLVPYDDIFEAFSQKDPLRGEMELADEYQFELGDPVLIALRESFGLTYARRLDHAERTSQRRGDHSTSCVKLKVLGGNPARSRANLQPRPLAGSGSRNLQTKQASGAGFENWGY